MAKSTAQIERMIRADFAAAVSTPKPRAPMNIDNLTQFDKDLLLRWFLYHMPMGQTCEGRPMKDGTAATRIEFMRQFPAVYNQLFGNTVKVMLGDNPA